MRNLIKNFLFALLLLPGLASAQQLINCSTGVPCDPTTGPAQTGTGDSFWKSFGKVNANFNTLYLNPGSVLFSSTGNLNYNSVASGPANSWMYMVQAITGIAANGVASTVSPFFLDISGDTVNTTTLGANNLKGMFIQLAPATGHTGGREAFEASLAITGTPGVTPPGDYVGAKSSVLLSAPLGGASGAYTNSLGSIFSANAIVLTTSAATNLRSIITEEFDIGLVTGSSASDKYGISIVQKANDAIRGTYDDDAIVFSQNDATTITWANGISFGSYAHRWPFGADSTLITAQQRQIGPASSSIALYGVDWRNVTFQGGGAAFISTGFSVNPTGAVSSTGLTSTAGLTSTGAAVAINKNSNFATEIGDGSTTSTVTIGGGANAVGISATTATINGTVQINNSNNAGTNIGTGTTTSTVTLGGGSNTVALNGSAVNVTGPFQVNTNNNATATINTGTSTSTVTIGGGSNTVSINGATNNVNGATNINLNNNAATNIGTGSTTNGVNLGGGSNTITINGVINANVSQNHVANINTGTTTSAVHIADGNGNAAVTIGNGTGKVSISGPLLSAAGTQFSVASGTGACATSSTLVGGVQAGNLTCTGSTGASTVTLTLVAATTAYTCWGRDITTPTVVTQTGAVSTTGVTLTLTSVTANDVVQFGCLGY